MHELSIALSLIERLTEIVRDESAVGVDEVRCRVGVLTSVDPAALQSAFAIAANDTPFQHVTLTVVSVPLAIYCVSCQATVDLDGLYPLRCPRCGQASSDIRRGQELEIESLSLIEPVDAVD